MTGYQVTHCFVRSVREVGRYTDTYVRLPNFEMLR